MKVVRVEIDSNGYDIRIGSRAIDGYDFPEGRYAVITDENVLELYGARIMDSLNLNGVEADVFSIPAGEQSKNLRTIEVLADRMSESGYTRDSTVIALGGGVVGDTAGFLAATYHRGVDLIQIPTTLLAAVDSSVGGKNGVNLSAGKNQVGTFYQPNAVLFDPGFLETLPSSEIDNGIAEVIKHAVIKDSDLFDYLVKNISDKGNVFYERIVEDSCRIKADVVAKDEKESEYRKILNFGHTIGHAVETLAEYKIPHGAAVAIGMVYEAHLARKIGLCEPQAAYRIEELIGEVGLQTRYGFDVDKALAIMQRDKKNTKDGIFFVLPKTIGEVVEADGRVAHQVNERYIRDILTNL